MRLLALVVVAVFLVSCESTAPSKAPPQKEPAPAKKAAPAPAPTDALDRVIAAPGATGLLITSVQPGSQADRLGIESGDILLRYDGKPTPDYPSLNAAVGAAEGTVRLLLLRNGKELSRRAEKGRIGITLIPVQKGVAGQPLPPNTVTAFDFSRLADRPQDSWYAFHRGEERCGWGRIRAQLVGDRLLVLTEEIFEDGTQLLDHEVTCITTADDVPLLRMTAFRDRMNDWERFGTACAAGEDEFKWTVVSRGEGSNEEASQIRIGKGIVPAYILETLASFMPREKGACFRFSALFEGSGRVGLPSALVCTGTEKVDVAGTPTPVYRFEWQTLGGTTGAVYWLDGAGHVLRASYGEIHVERTTADDVLENQPESVLSR
jgi:hypothetical protein